MNVKENFSLLDFTKKNLFQFIGLLVLVLNMWLAYQLAPLVGRIQALEVRAGGIEDDLMGLPVIVNRFVVVESKVVEMDKKIDRIETKVDHLLTK